MNKNANTPYHLLKHRLLTGQYKPGTQLKETILAAEFNVSRTPIRAALDKLVKDGLVNKKKGAGVRVAAWTQWDVNETFQLRILLEPYAAKLAAERRTSEELVLLQRSNTLFAEALEGPTDELATRTEEANRLFHTTILKASRSDRLISILENMIDMPILVRSFHLYNRAEIAQSYHHHLDLTQSIQNKQAGLAQQAMALHLSISYQRFLDACQNKN